MINLSDVVAFTRLTFRSDLIDVGHKTVPPTIPAVLTQVLAIVNTLLFAVAPVILVVMIVSAGIKRLLAADNPKAVQESTNTLMWAVIGYAVVLLSYLIVRLGALILGYDISTAPELTL